jgi:hypothetical protein
VTQRPVRLTPGPNWPTPRAAPRPCCPRLLLRLELVDSDLVHLQKAELAPLRADLAAARTNAPGPDTMFRTGRYLLRIGRLIPARRAFEELIRAAPDDLRGYEGLADTHRGWWGQPGAGPGPRRRARHPGPRGRPARAAQLGGAEAGRTGAVR